MSRFLLLALLSLLWLAAPAQAQRQSDFEFAMESGDYALAEEAVLVEIERVRNNPDPVADGELQLTLASLRLAQENYAGAIEPAHQAQRLLGDSAPSLALLLARAEFGVRANAATAETLRNLLLASGTDPSLAGHIHHGAIQLATWAMREHRFDDARDAWRMALRTSDASLYGANYGRGVSLIGDAAATLYATRPGAHDFAELQAKFEEGLRLLNRNIPDDDSLSTSREERAYAQAVAWYRVWRAYAEPRRAPPASEGLPPTGDWVEILPVQNLPICDVEITPRPSPRMPRDDRIDAAAAVLLMRFSQAGEVVEQRLVAVAGGDEAFAASVAEGASRWRVEIDRQPGCHVTLIMTKAVVFRFRE